MNHTDSADSANTQWLNAWLEGQRALLARWQEAAATAPQVEATHMQSELLRSLFNPQAMPEAFGALQNFQSLLQSSAAQSFAQFGATGLSSSHTGSNPLSDSLQAMWQQVTQSFAVGPAREQQRAWQEYAQAFSEYQTRQQAMLQLYGKVFAQALDAVREQAQPGTNELPLNDLHKIYAVWIDGGEQAFKKLAHDEAFLGAQAASTNALSRLKQARNALLDYALKEHDLPTRSELNSVHLRVRELTARVNELEQQRSTPAPAKRSRAPKVGSS